MATAQDAADGSRPGRGRRRGALALVVVASILVFPAILATWVNRQVLNTDNWTTTSTELLQNKLIRDQLTVFLVAKLYENVDVEAQVREALPPRVQAAGRAGGERAAGPRREHRQQAAGPAAGPGAVGEREPRRPPGASPHPGGGRTDGVDGGRGRNAGPPPPTAAGRGPRRRRRAAGAGAAGERGAGHDPPLGPARHRPDGAQGAPRAPDLLVALSILLFGAALLLAPDWRRQALRAYGAGLFVAGLAVLVTQSLAGDQLRQRPGVDRCRPAGDRRRLDDRHAAAGPGGDRRDPLRSGHDRRGLGGGAGAAGRRPPPCGRAVRPQPRSHVRELRGARRADPLVGADPRHAKPAAGAHPDRADRRGCRALRRQIVREHPTAERSDTTRWIRGSVDRSVGWARSGASAGRTAWPAGPRA